MNSVITTITPLATKTGTSPEITVTGLNFTDGGNPRLYVDGVEMAITSFSNTQIVFTLPKSTPIGIYDLVVLNGSEQI